MWRPKPTGFTIDLLCFRKSCAPMTKKANFIDFFFFPCNNRFESYCRLNKYQQATQSETKLFYWVEVNNHQVVFRLFFFFSPKFVVFMTKLSCQFYLLFPIPWDKISYPNALLLCPSFDSCILWPSVKWGGLSTWYPSIIFIDQLCVFYLKLKRLAKIGNLHSVSAN